MSGTNSNSPPGANGGGDPSMEDILASIRRILAEDEPASGEAAAPAGAAPPAVKDDVLVLDASMLAPTAPVEPEPVAIALPDQTAMAVAAAPPAPVTAPAPTSAPTPAVVVAAPRPAAPPRMDPAMSRPTRPNNAVTFEDAVRNAFQPVIQQWLETALPKMAERMVRTEVERLVGGAVR